MQSKLFDESEYTLSTKDSVDQNDIASIEIPAHKRKRTGRKKLPEDLPRIDIIHDLAESEKVCAKGHALVAMSDKISEQLDIIPMQLRVLRHIRKQYH